MAVESAAGDGNGAARAGEGYIRHMLLLDDPTDTERLKDLQRGGTFFWLDLSSPTREQLSAVGQALGWHPLSVEDTQEFGQRPKVDTYGEHLLLVYFGARLEHGRPEPVEVHVHVGGDFVVTVHHQPCPRFEAIRRAGAAEDRHQVLYRVIDALTDSLLDVLDVVADIVDRHEAEVYAHPRARDRDEMARLRQALGRLRRVM